MGLSRRTILKGAGALPFAVQALGSSAFAQTSPEDQRRELGEAIKQLKERTGVSRVALVANSRGGNSVRGYIRNGGGTDVSHAVF